MTPLAVFRDEFRRIFALRPVFSVLVLAVGLYAVLYPQPYLNEALRKVPLAVVDQDETTSSRDLARRIDASPDVAVVTKAMDFAAARREVFSRDVFGVLVIPHGFERDLLHGRVSPVALYADASYFLIYQRIALGVVGVARTLGAEIEIKRLVGLGIDLPVAAAAADPMRLTAIPLFNPQGGYATYILPAAFVLILQQTLLIGVGLLGTSPLPQQEGGSPASATATVLGKLLAYLALEAVIVPFYMIVLPFLYGIPRLGEVWPILAFAVPFVVAVGALGLIVAAVFRSPLVIQLVMAAIGLPFFFLSGFSWPVEAMPRPIQLAAQLVPSTAAIDGFVRLSQLGARMSDVGHQLVVLCALAVVYGGIAVLLQRRRARAW